ncbi:hypothetical protein CI763_00145 [Klebsiella pneumoniae subsp. pneumoniae]|nr:hypothetical protein CI763_00145 [Klebsiella pneumoniae subsp. pneumoniae]
MMSLWDALRMNMMISYQELVRTFHNTTSIKNVEAASQPENQHAMYWTDTTHRTRITSFISTPYLFLLIILQLSCFCQKFFWAVRSWN